MANCLRTAQHQAVCLYCTQLHTMSPVLLLGALPMGTHKRPNAPGMQSSLEHRLLPMHPCYHIPFVCEKMLAHKIPPTVPAPFH